MSLLQWAADKTCGDGFMSAYSAPLVLKSSWAPRLGQSAGWSRWAHAPRKPTGHNWRTMCQKHGDEIAHVLLYSETLDDSSLNSLAVNKNEESLTWK